MSDPRDRSRHPDDLEVDAPASEEEQAQAEALREALEDPTRPSEQAELARAVSSAWAPRDLSAETHRALVEQALRRDEGRRRKQRGSVIRVSFGVSVLVAAAAAVFLLVEGDHQAPARAVAAVAISRSTQGLFPDPFAPTGGESARIDRIAVARAADLRDNEFARWGIR
jgi:hypothetical protein